MIGWPSAGGLQREQDFPQQCVQRKAGGFIELVAEPVQAAQHRDPLAGGLGEAAAGMDHGAPPIRRMLLALDHVARFEPIQHRGDAGRGNAQLLGQLARAGCAQAPDEVEGPQIRVVQIEAGAPSDFIERMGPLKPQESAEKIRAPEGRCTCHDHLSRWVDI